MTDYTEDLTGSWTPALASVALYRALLDAREHGKTTLFISDGKNVAIIGPPELDPAAGIRPGLGGSA